MRFRFYKSLVHPSEMVGIIAAQSIREPSTQLTPLIRVEWNTEILIDEDGLMLMHARVGETVQQPWQARVTVGLPLKT